MMPFESGQDKGMLKRHSVLWRYNTSDYSNKDEKHKMLESAQTINFKYCKPCRKKTACFQVHHDRTEKMKSNKIKSKIKHSKDSLYQPRLESVSSTKVNLNEQ